MMFLTDTFICTTPRNQVSEHKHIMPHLILSERGVNLCVDGKQYPDVHLALVDGKNFHSVSGEGTDCCMFLLFPFTSLYYQAVFLLNNEDIRILDSPAFSLPFLSEDACDSFLKSCLPEKEPPHMDERVLLILKNIEDGSFKDETVSGIARELNLSESRLEHLFSKETHLHLKHVLLLFKFKAAYTAVLNGTAITDAAYEAGFADSAHLAKTAKELTGISIRDFCRNTADF